MEETYYCYSLKDIMISSSVANIPYLKWAAVWNTVSSLSFQYLTNLGVDDEIEYLLNPLINRWYSENIVLFVSNEQFAFEKDKKISNVTKALAPILKKLNTIIPKYKEEYKRLKTILDKDSFKTSSKSSNKAIVKQNDTPTSYGDYRADNYMSNYSETSNENENSVETNELETYDSVVSRFRNLPQEIINEMKEFEIWI